MAKRTPLLVVCAVAAAFAIGCEDTNKTINDRDHDGIADKYDRHPDRATKRQDDVLTDRRRDDLRDRDLRGLDEVPRDARRVDLGDGPRVTYHADRGGRVYLYDVDADRVIYSDKVRRGDEVVADPDRGSLELNDRRLSDITLPARHAYRMYFLPD
jgi:hypothetical protein